MGKFVNQKGKIRIVMIVRCGLQIYIARKGKGIYVGYNMVRVINDAQRGGRFTRISHNYELINRCVKNNPILRLRDQQPDGLLIAQHPIQQKLPL